ncbi:MAG: DUF3363 domain-containing protein [Hyphomonadaceae bacterium]|nr:DUF3363 domain-containing protein [Hyphomonadaceae bacterium]
MPNEARIAAILTVGRAPSTRCVDKTIAAYAARNDGFYEPQEHYEVARMTARIPGGDVEGHIEAHVRRLEALRRAGIVGRLDGDHWVIPRDYLERAAAYDEREGRKLVAEAHSAVALDRQITAEAATWLDRQLVDRHPVETAPMGFGNQVQRALERRKQQLIAHGLAKRRDDGSINYQPDLLATLQRREVDRVGGHLAGKRTDGRTYVPARDGSMVRGHLPPRHHAGQRQVRGGPVDQHFRWSNGGPSWSATAVARSSASSAAWVSHGSSAYSAIAASLVDAVDPKT